MVLKAPISVRSRLIPGVESFLNQRERIVSKAAVNNTGSSESTKSGDTKRLPSLTNGRSKSKGTGPCRVQVIGGIGRPFTHALKLARSPRAASRSLGT